MRTAKNVVPGEMRIAEQERDDVLLRRAAKGDEEAFTLIYRRHQAAMYRFALRMTGNTWAAEEIVQDVFMTLMRDPKKYDATRGALGAFLYGVARNRVMPDWHDSFAAASRPGLADGQTGNISRRAAARERGAMKGFA